MSIPVKDKQGNVVVVMDRVMFPDAVKQAWWANDIHEVPNWMRRLPAPFIRLLTKELGAAGAWTMTNGGRTCLLDGTFDIDSDTYKMALFLSTSDLGAASTTFAGVSNEHAAANGYSAGGEAVTLTLTGTTTVKIDIDTDPVWTANGGSIIARFAAIYEVAGNILFYCLLDSTPADVTATDGNTLTVAAHADGVATLA